MAALTLTEHRQLAAAYAAEAGRAENSAAIMADAHGWRNPAAQDVRRIARALRQQQRQHAQAALMLDVRERLACLPASGAALSARLTR
jgi:hypothetical protein